MKEATKRAFVTATLACAGILTVLSLSAQENAPQKRPTPPLPPLPLPPTNFARPLPRQTAPPPAMTRFSLPQPPNLEPPSFQVSPPVVNTPVSPLAPVAPTIQPALPSSLTAFTWDAERKEYTTKPGDEKANYTFWFTNTSDAEVIINGVRTSCGCTLAKLPATPWPIAPGTNGPIEVSIDLRGKSGTITKSVTVESSAGVKALIVSVNVTGGPAPVSAFAVNHPAMGDQERLENMQKSLADRQVVFKDAKCATCHADPAKNQVDGLVIYRGICATCHDSPLRAAAVTDLKALKHETDIDYWKQWISHGRPGSMMPAYAVSEGGPLNDAQIQALAQYCMSVFQPAANRASQVPAAATNAALRASAVTAFPVPTRK
jgi:mono/diheme cytochrome c family protein